MHTFRPFTSVVLPQMSSIYIYTTLSHLMSFRTGCTTEEYMDPGGTVILTGATGGLGKALASLLIELPPTFDLVLTTRNLESRNTQSLRKIIGTDPRCQILPLELESLEDVRYFSAHIRAQISLGKLKPIYALVLNAAYMSHLRPTFTIDGYAKEFQVNYLANFLLVHQLLHSIHRGYGRIIFVASFAHDPTKGFARMFPLPRQLWMPVEILARPYLDRGELKSKAGLRRYAASKMCLMMLMHSIQDRLDRNKDLRNITTVAVDPGWIPATEIMREQGILFRMFVERFLKAFTPMVQRLFTNSLLRTPSRSAADILHRAFEPQPGEDSSNAKAMVINGSKMQRSSEESRDNKKQAILWESSVLLARLSQSEMEAFDI